MKSTFESAESWKPCESGLLVECAKQARAAHAKKTATQFGSGIITLLVIVGLGVWSINHWRSPQEYHFGGIACHEVQANIPAMMAGNLPEEKLQVMQIHLKECPVCKEIIANMQAQPVTRVRFENAPVARREVGFTDSPAGSVHGRSLAAVVRSIGH